MIKPAFIFTDHAVLQREKPVPVWGECDASSLIVSFAGNSVVATVKNGRFEATLPAMQAGTRGELRLIAGEEVLSLSDVAVGEVWLAGGQSNMEHPVFCTTYEEKALRENRDIRLFTVPRRTCYEGETWGFHFIETEAKEAPWQPCTKEAALCFTAIGYFFAARLWQELRMPIGIISCNWGGTIAENWVEEAYLASDPLAARALVHDRTLPAIEDPAVLAEHIAYQTAMKEFCLSHDAMAMVRETGVPYFLRHCGPSIPCSEAASYYRRPCVLRRSMLARVTPYALRGVIWHQGESNGRADYQDSKEWYKALMHALVADWRAAFRAPTLPFYIVQIAAFNLDGANRETWWPVKEAQAELMAEDAHCRMVVSYDLGEPDNIHPAQKQVMGERLADAALDGEYGVQKPWRSPTLVTGVRRDREVTLIFRDATRLHARPGEGPAGVFVYDKSGKSQEVPFVLEGNSMRIAIPVGVEPVAIGYGQRNYSVTNVMNEAELPVAPFHVEIR